MQSSLMCEQPPLMSIEITDILNYSQQFATRTYNLNHLQRKWQPNNEPGRPDIVKLCLAALTIA